MTFSCPSALAAAISAFMPPPAAADVAVAHFAELPLFEPVAPEPPELFELLQPAASTMPPIAAVATIALNARKVVPSQPASRNRRAGIDILARQAAIVANDSEQKVAD